MYGIELSRAQHSRRVRRAENTGAEAVTGPFAWHHCDFVKIPSFSISPSRALPFFPSSSLLLSLSAERYGVYVELDLPSAI